MAHHSIKLPPQTIVRKFFFSAWIILFLSVHSIFAQISVGTQNIAIPDALGETSISIFSLENNPANFSKIEKNAAEFLVSPSRFGLKELSSAHFVLSQKISPDFTIAARLSGLGNSLYNQFSLAGFASYAVTRSFFAGIGADFSRLAIESAETETALQIHIGATLQISKDVSAGIALQNISRADYSSNGSPIDQTALFSLGFLPFDDFHIAGTAILSLAHSSSFALSARYDFQKILQFRFAVETFPHSAEFGVSYLMLENWMLKSSFLYNDRLGFSPNVGFSYNW